MANGPEDKAYRLGCGWMLNKLQSLTRKRRKRIADKRRRRNAQRDIQERKET